MDLKHTPTLRDKNSRFLVQKSNAINLNIDCDDLYGDTFTSINNFTTLSVLPDSYQASINSSSKTLRSRPNAFNSRLNNINHFSGAKPKSFPTRQPSSESAKRRHRRGTRFYNQKFAVYNFLQRPKGFIAIGYHIIVSSFVFSCLLMTILSSVKQYEESASWALKYGDMIILCIFSIEMMARVWSSSCMPHYRGWDGFMRFLYDPYRLIDLVIIITSVVALIFESNMQQALSLSLRGLRSFQLFQVMRLEFRFRPWKTLASVVWSQRHQLIISVYLAFLALLFVSFAVYFVEKGTNPQFNNIASSLWWGVVTFGTVGYGDIYPITPLGKILSCTFFMIGVSLFSLPAGILGTGLALKVDEQKRSRLVTKRTGPATMLIQLAWRLSNTQHNETSKTWNAFLQPITTFAALSRRHKNAIRFIMIVKYFVALRKFLKTSKPYDIKDVLEQYAAGQADLLGGVRCAQYSLDCVVEKINWNSFRLRECQRTIAALTALLGSASSYHQLATDKDDKDDRKPIKLFEPLEALPNQFRRNSF